MKSKIIIFSILIVVLFMTSCTILSESLGESSESLEHNSHVESAKFTEGITTITDPFEVYNWNQISPEGNLSIGEENIFLPRDEAIAFLSYFDEQFSDSFIKYEELSPLGNIDAMVLNDADNGSIGTLINYTYTFRVYDDRYEHGYFEFDVKVEHLTTDDSRDITDYKPLDGSLDTELKHESPENMSSSKHKRKSIIHENSLYQYDSNGEVKWISIIIDDYRIVVGRCQFFGKEESNNFEEFYFKDYISVEANFLTLLLSGAEYETVVESFRQMISA